MAEIHPYIVQVDIPPATPGNTTPSQTSTLLDGVVNKMSIKRTLSQPETLSFTADGADTASMTPGAPASGTRIFGFSLDGGAGVDARMLSGGVQATVQGMHTVDEQGSANSIGSILNTSHIARMTAQQVSIGDFFTGKRGYVKTVIPAGASTSGMIAPNNVLPYFEGIQYATISDLNDTLNTALAFTWVVDAAIKDKVLDGDVNHDTRLRATDNVAQRLGSLVDPQQAQFVIDSGDFGIDHTHPAAQTVTLGHLGTTSMCTFKDLADATTTQPILEGSQAQPQTLQMCASASFIGGDTHHGLPQTGRITDICTINQRLNDATGNYRSGMPVVSIYGDRNNGGVYYWPGDGSLHPWSQAMGVNALWYDESISTIHAATDAGVYRQVSDPSGTTNTKLVPVPWGRVGSMALKVLKVQTAPWGTQDTSLTTKATLFALVQGQSSSGFMILQENSTATTGYSYDGWKQIYSGSAISDFAVASTVDGSGNVTAVLYVISNDQTALGFITRKVIRDDAGTGGAGEMQIQIPWAADELASGSGPAALGLDPMVQFGSDQPGGDGTATYLTATSTGTYVRTDTGSSRLYYIPGIGTNCLTAAPASGPGSLTDSDGFQVMVNHVFQHSAGIIQWTQSGGAAGIVTVRAMACTNRGIFVSPNIYGGPWYATDGQSNLGDVDIKRGASAPPRPWAEKGSSATGTPSKRILSRVFGIADQSFYVSEDGTITWRDALSEPLDAGPAFFELIRKHTGSFPTNNTTSVLYPDPVNGPYELRREMDGLSRYNYVLYNPTSAAPGAAHRDAEISQISTPALVPEVPASQLLIDAMARFLWYTGRPQVIVTVKSYFDDDADPLRFLMPTHKVLVNGSINSTVVTATSDSASPPTYTTALVTFTNAVFYVLDHQIDFDADTDGTGCYTTTRLGSLLLDDRTDPLKVTADLWYQVSRSQIYRSRGRH